MNPKQRRRTSQLSNRIINQFISACAVIVVILVGGFFLSYFIFSQFVWQSGNPLYHLLKILQYLSPVIIFLGLVSGFFGFTVYSIKRATRYVDVMVDAAKSLSHPDSVPIELPEELVDIQNELNLAREQALRNIDAANEAVQRKNDLIMYLAHDLKTPLASVIGYLNLLRDEGQISEELRQKYLSITLDKANRLEDLINEFFEIARFNLSTMTLQYSKINLTRLLEQLIFEFTPLLQEKRLRCQVQIAADLMLRCDADKLQRVFDNLLRNAVMYSHENTVIRIFVTQQNGAVILRFINQGDTIPEEKLERIFEQFYRLDAARSTKSGGAGLGLAIAKQIVELHGGSVTAKSEQEQTEFVVTLPNGENQP